MPPYRRRNSAANRPPRPPPAAGILRTFYPPLPQLAHPDQPTQAGIRARGPGRWRFPLGPSFRRKPESNLQGETDPARPPPHPPIPVPKSAIITPTPAGNCRNAPAKALRRRYNAP